MNLSSITATEVLICFGLLAVGMLIGYQFKKGRIKYYKERHQQAQRDIIRLNEHLLEK
jgi:hypothetical protein